MIEIPFLTLTTLDNDTLRITEKSIFYETLLDIDIVYFYAIRALFE